MNQLPTVNECTVKISIIFWINFWGPNQNHKSYPEYIIASSTNRYNEISLFANFNINNLSEQHFNLGLMLMQGKPMHYQQFIGQLPEPS